MYMEGSGRQSNQVITYIDMHRDDASLDDGRPCNLACARFGVSPAAGTVVGLDSS